MKRIILNFSYIIFLLLIFSVSSIHAQGLIKEVSLEEQIENSTLLIEGKVISKKAFRDNENNNIYTLNTVEVYKIFKGDVVSVIDVITPGGVFGLDMEIVTPSLKLKVNDVGVFALHNNNIKLESASKNSLYKPYSSSLGFYKYNFYKDVATNLFNKKVGIESSFYTEIISHTKMKYIDVANFSVAKKLMAKSQNKSNLVPSAITFTPTTVSAGTQTVLTINGSGFGSVKGKVGFSEADDGGDSFIDALDTQVLTWTDTQVTVEVPSEAGTGIIQIRDSFDDSATSSSVLTVSYSEANIVTDQVASGANAGLDVAYPTRHINENSSGGYTWQMFSGFDANADAKASFLRAFETWRCETGINWVIGAVTTTNTVANDGVNVIRFDVGTELPNNVLGRCTSRYSGCFVNGNTSIDIFVEEMDVVFNDNPDNTGSESQVETWNFGTGASLNSEYDFESVALHELGHGHQLAHVIDSNSDVMHFSLFNGKDERVLGANNIIAANSVQDRSTSNAVCGFLEMTDYSGSCELSVDEVDFENNISLYPNPAKQQFFIKSSIGVLDRAEILDVHGRLISRLDLSNTNFEGVSVNVSGVSKGLYLVNIYFENRYVTKKLVVK